MKNSEKLNEAIGNIDSRMIDAAYERQASRKSIAGVFGKIGSVAAVAALVAFAIVLSQFARKNDNISAGTDTEDTQTETVITDYEVEAGVCHRGQIWGDYIVRYTEQDGLQKYNIHTGERSAAAPGHLIVSSWATVGNTLYFVSENNETSKSTLAAYDLVTNETKNVYETAGMLNVCDAYEDRILMLSTTGTRPNYDRCYLWFDTKTSETEELTDRYITNAYMFYEFIDGRIVWRYMDESYTGDELSRYYSTDLQGNDYRKYNYDYYYGNHYRQVIEEYEDGTKHNNMYVTLAGETEEKLLIENLDFWLFTETKIIYTKTLPSDGRTVAYVSEDGRKRMDQCGGDVYIMDPDGSNDHLLFHTDECISAMNDTLNHRRWYAGEDYAAIFSEYELPERGVLERVIIFNISTGEFVVEHEAEITAETAETQKN